MEVIPKLVSTTRRLAMEEDELKEELAQLKIQLLAEENNLVKITNEQEKFAQQNALLQQNMDLANTNYQLMNTFRNVAKSAIQMHSILKVFMKNAHPSDQEQAETFAKLDSNFRRTLEKYELCTTYKNILEEETKVKELDNDILKLRNHLQELSAQI